MHAIEGSDFHEVLKTGVRLHQNSLEFYERLFLYEHSKMLLCEQSQHEGVLSPHASPMCSRTKISIKMGGKRCRI